MFSLEELRLIAHCVTYALVREGLKPGDWLDAKSILDEITIAIHEGNLRREDNADATRNPEHDPGQAPTPDPGA